MKIYNNVEYKPNFTGNIIKNEHILNAIEKSDYISRCAFENIFDRMQIRKDGFVFELAIENAKESQGKLSNKNNACQQFVLKIMDKSKNEKEKILTNINKPKRELYNGILRQVNRVLKTIYNKPAEQLKEEKKYKPQSFDFGFDDSVQEFNALDENIELIEKNDLEQFDSFFRDKELFDEENDSLVELNSQYGTDDVELCDNIKSHFFDALF